MPIRPLVIAIAALSMVPSLATAKEAAKVNAKGEKLICRSVEITGSRMPKRICQTAAEWKAENGGTRQEDARDIAAKP